MKRRIRFHIKERLRRLFYIKNELSITVLNSLKKNQHCHLYTSYIADAYKQQTSLPRYSISRHKMQCFLNSSFRIPSSKFRLSRFSMNIEARKNKLPNVLRTGW